jgi:hypothetical protein
VNSSKGSRRRSEVGDDGVPPKYPCLEIRRWKMFPFVLTFTDVRLLLDATRGIQFFLSLR